MSSSTVPSTPQQWNAALDALPAASEQQPIPAFFFAHGSPMLLRASGSGPRAEMMRDMDAKSSRADFLRDFGPSLLKKYQPKGIVIFSAHWEAHGEHLVTDYGDSNPLLYDYYGFDKWYYELKFDSRGDSTLSNRVVDLLKQSGLKARTTSKLEARGDDGRGFSGPGLDHGVFVPFYVMFGETFRDIPLVEVTIDGSLDPGRNFDLGKAVAQLRREGILVLSGGLTVHTFRDTTAWSEATAKPVYREFHRAILDSLVTDPTKRKSAMMELVKHPGFRLAHPREEHFIPIYVAAGAGANGSASVLCGLYGAVTVAFM